MDPKFFTKGEARGQHQVLPLGPAAAHAFAELKSELGKASLGAIQVGVPFELGTDASDHAIAAILSQGGRPVAFMSRTLSHCEKWQHFLKGRHFTIVTIASISNLD